MSRLDDTHARTVMARQVIANLMEASTPLGIDHLFGVDVPARWRGPILQGLIGCGHVSRTVTAAGPVYALTGAGSDAHIPGDEPNRCPATRESGSRCVDVIGHDGDHEDAQGTKWSPT